ncbi:hypothetical protein LPJ66_006624 [Kickxella alabastrina]|uniref:Uncharacterized protein n=1 Tax=Kickxella alabastrina TaxID=61397 RepID=A0ACC1IBR8_9FUNG|nr:hypothetical protein LPJ66_006624 [Kickxella alabastrina]
MDNMLKSPVRYSLRTRTPIKPVAAPPPAPPPTARKRARPAASSKTPTPKKTTRKRAFSNPTNTTKRNASTKEPSPETMETPDAAELSSEDEAYTPDQRTSPAAMPPPNVRRSTTSDVPVRRGPGRPRKDGSMPQPRNPLRAPLPALSTTLSARRTAGAIVTFSTASTPAGDSRRLPVNLTKHDPFKVENLTEASRIMQSVAVNGTPNDDRYELMKMSDALKMCGYELGVVNPGTGAVDEVYQIISWAVRAAGPSGPTHPPPGLSEEGRGVLLKCFATVGRRIREESRDMAAYHRRHALRKLALAEKQKQKQQQQQKVEGEMEDVETEAEAGKNKPAHRRNPLRIPGPLVDIWREPYKKSHDNEPAAGHDSQVSDA